MIRLIALALVALAGIARAQEPVAPAPWGGFEIRSADGRYAAKLGAEVMNDWAFYFGESADLKAHVGSGQNGIEFRQAYASVSGKLPGQIAFKAQYGLSGGSVALRDVYLAMGRLPVVGNVRVGQFKEPFGLEEATSTPNVTFLEKPSYVVFIPGRNDGIMLHNAVLGDRATWAAGYFKQSSAGGKATGDGNNAVTGRATVAPIIAGSGRRVVHLGLGGSVRRQEPDTVKLAVTPESHLARTYIAANFPGDYAEVDFEAAAVVGSVSVQGEYLRATGTMGGSDRTAVGFAAFVSWFPTGEHRPYVSASGVFGQVKPRANFREGGPGAIELVARFSQLDLGDVVSTGGTLRDVTLGATWYFNPQVKVMANYILADLADYGTGQIWQMRFQFAY